MKKIVIIIIISGVLQCKTGKTNEENRLHKLVGLLGDENNFLGFYSVKLKKIE